MIPLNHVVDFLLVSLRMSSGTRGRANAHGHANGPEDDPANLPPPPSMVQLMAMFEANHANNIRLLERIECNTSQGQVNQVSIKEFTCLTPPVFSYSSEPLDADYWLHTMERKLQVGHVVEAD